MSQPERQAVINLGETLKTLTGYDSERIYARSEWGSDLTFEPFRKDFERSFGLARIFADLPYELFPDDTLNRIGETVANASKHYGEIDNFNSATANNAKTQIQTLGDRVKTLADEITVQMAQWISYLAYQKGDVSQNISKLEKAISDGEQMVSAAKERLETEEAQMKTIIQQAQDFSGDKGVSVFTEQFVKSAQQNTEEANGWLIAAGIIYFLTLVAICVSIYQLDTISVWYQWASRAALIGVLLTSGLWCGKTYRILRHQQTINQHKANSLKSFLLFRDAADNDEATRNAVLMETTKSIFSSASSGFINDGGSQKESEIRLIETSRAASTLARTGKSGGSVD